MASDSSAGADPGSEGRRGGDGNDDPHLEQHDQKSLSGLLFSDPVLQRDSLALSDG